MLQQHRNDAIKNVISFHVSAFRGFYMQFMSKLHEVSSDSQGIVSLCALFEYLVRIQNGFQTQNLIKLLFCRYKHMSRIYGRILHLMIFNLCDLYFDG